MSLILKDEFSTAIKLPVLNGESRQQENSTDWILEFEAVAGGKGVKSALNSYFEKDFEWKTYEANGVTLYSNGRKHMQALEANTNAKHLLVASVKGVTYRNIINKEKQNDSKFLTGRAHKVMTELENRFSPNN